MLVCVRSARHGQDGHSLGDNTQPEAQNRGGPAASLPVCGYQQPQAALTPACLHPPLRGLHPPTHPFVVCSFVHCFLQGLRVCLGSSRENELQFCLHRFSILRLAFKCLLACLPLFMKHWMTNHCDCHSRTASKEKLRCLAEGMSVASVSHLLC